jgi:hypothetical protein
MWVVVPLVLLTAGIGTYFYRKRIPSDEPALRDDTEDLEFGVPDPLVQWLTENADSIRAKEVKKIDEENGCTRLRVTLEEGTVVNVWVSGPAWLQPLPSLTFGDASTHVPISAQGTDAVHVGREIHRLICVHRESS